MTMFSSLHDDFMDAPLPAVAQGETKCWRWCGLKFCRCYPPPRPVSAPRARDVVASAAHVPADVMRSGVAPSHGEAGTEHIAGEVGTGSPSAIASRQA